MKLLPVPTNVTASPVSRAYQQGVEAGTGRYGGEAAGGDGERHRRLSRNTPAARSRPVRSVPESWGSQHGALDPNRRRCACPALRWLMQYPRVVSVLQESSKREFNSIFRCRIEWPRRTCHRPRTASRTTVASEPDASSGCGRSQERRDRFGGGEAGGPGSSLQQGSCSNSS